MTNADKNVLVSCGYREASLNKFLKPVGFCVYVINLQTKEMFLYTRNGHAHVSRFIEIKPQDIFGFEDMHPTSGLSQFDKTLEFLTKKDQEGLWFEALNPGYYF